MAVNSEDAPFFNFISNFFFTFLMQNEHTSMKKLHNNIVTGI